MTVSPGLRKRLRPKTYSIGWYLVGGFLVLEVCALVLIFWFRQAVVKIETEGPSVPGAVALERQPPPLENLPVPEIQGRLDVAKAPRGVPTAASLVEEARRYRQAGDFALAEAALRQALELQPGQPVVLTHLALLQEGRGKNAEALELWRQILQGGAPEETQRLARDRAELLQERLRLEEAARARERLLLQSPRWLVVDKIQTRPDPLPQRPVEIQKDFFLRWTPSGRAPDAGQVRIQVYFYDRLADGTLKPAPIEARFLSSSPDWTGGEGLEVLQARYFRRAAPGEERTYYGFVCRVYYGEQLQDERAEPIELLGAFGEAVP
jgi:tetratricopeptide (TPR) repeat protein